MLSNPQFVGTILFMGIECQHFTYFRLRPTTLCTGHVWRKLQDQVIVNHLVVLFKRYIYLKKGDKTAPSLTCLKAYLKCFENLEQDIASENKKLDYHYKKGTS